MNGQGFALLVIATMFAAFLLWVASIEKDCHGTSYWRGAAFGAALVALLAATITAGFFAAH